MTWRIYYADGSMVEGETEADWLAAPDDGVQVVVRVPMQDGIGWSCRGVVVRSGPSNQPGPALSEPSNSGCCGRIASPRHRRGIAHR